jgi:hypothetical protein
MRCRRAVTGAALRIGPPCHSGAGQIDAVSAADSDDAALAVLVALGVYDLRTTDQFLEGFGLFHDTAMFCNILKVSHPFFLTKFSHEHPNSSNFGSEHTTVRKLLLRCRFTRVNPV